MVNFRYVANFTFPTLYALEPGGVKRVADMDIFGSLTLQCLLLRNKGALVEGIRTRS